MGVSLHWQKADKRGLGYLKARADGLSGQGAGKNFKKLDKDSDGYLTEEELRAEFGEAEAVNLLNFHDLDEDGRVFREEFAETYAHWAATQKAVIDETPKKYRKFQLEDMEGDFNIEDISPKKQAKMIELAFQEEAKLKAAKQEL